jgi:predicted porin
MNRNEAFIALTSPVGVLRLGSPNSIGLGVAGDASPLGTASGSGYSIASGTMMNSVVQTRYNRSVRFDSAAIAGITASVLYAPGNDEATGTPSSASSGTSIALPIPNARTATEFGLKYVNGPLTASVAQIKQAEMTNTAGYYAGTGKDNKATSATIFGVNYKIDNTTVYYGMNTGDRLAAKGGSTWSNAVVESKGTRVAIKQTIGQYDVIAQQTTQETTGLGATDAKAKVTGLTGMYNLSKTSAAYIAYQKYDSGLAYSAASGTTTGDLKTVSIGMRKSF